MQATDVTRLYLPAGDINCIEALKFIKAACCLDRLCSNRCSQDSFQPAFDTAPGQLF